MTRFVMTLKQSVDLIEHAIINGESGDTIIPKLISMNVKDLVELFSEKYNKRIKPGEKLLESLINKSQSARIKINGEYTHIKSIYDFNETIDETTLNDYNSKINPLNKEQLNKFLTELSLI